jgi:hypothetical protein
MIEPTKAQFIELVDSSFIDGNATHKLEELLAGVQQLLAPQDGMTVQEISPQPQNEA